MFFDTHAHLTWPDFDSDIDGVIERATAAGITRMVTIGTDAESSRRAVELAGRFPNVYAAIGWHPGDVDEAPDDVRPTLRELAGAPRVVAIGETGLDYYRLPSTRGGSVEDDEPYRSRQKHLFRQQLELAVEFKKNVVIHTRGDCFEDTISIFENYADRLRAVFHCFVESVANMERIFTLGSLVSFTGILTFKNGQNVRDALMAAPLGKFMLETDSPFLAPVPYRGKRCEPAYVSLIAASAAEIKGCSLEELSSVTCEAARQFFGGLE